MLSFLTPIVKAFLTETGFESVNHAVQIFGGHGFIRETGIEQYVRDSRITLIYEGTTQIQAIDLLGRKVMMTQGKGLLLFVEEMQRVARQCAVPLPDIGAALERIAGEWATLSMATGGRAASNLDELGAASVDYLMYSGYACLAYCWARMALRRDPTTEQGREDRRRSVSDGQDRDRPLLHDAYAAARGNAQTRDRGGRRCADADRRRGFRSHLKNEQLRDTTPDA